MEWKKQTDAFGWLRRVLETGEKAVAAVNLQLKDPAKAIIGGNITDTIKQCESIPTRENPEDLWTRKIAIDALSKMWTLAIFGHCD